jgi:type IV secretion system protein VirD4
LECQLPVPAGVTPVGRSSGGVQEGQRIDDPANGGIRREPELAEHEDIAPEPATPTPEFEFAEEEADEDAVRARAFAREARGLARQAAMDPGDGIDL